jgi:hypothetical protein
VDVPNGERRQDRQQGDGENFRPSGQMLSRNRQGKQVYPQLPEGRGGAILTPSSTYTITACRNK